MLIKESGALSSHTQLLWLQPSICLGMFWKVGLFCFYIHMNTLYMYMLHWHWQCSSLKTLDAKAFTLRHLNTHQRHIFPLKSVGTLWNSLLTQVSKYRVACFVLGAQGEKFIYILTLVIEPQKWSVTRCKHYRIFHLKIQPGTVTRVKPFCSYWKTAGIPSTDGYGIFLALHLSFL